MGGLPVSIGEISAEASLRVEQLRRKTLIGTLRELLQPADARNESRLRMKKCQQARRQLLDDFAV